MVKETIHCDLSDHKVLYSLKHDMQMLMPIEGDIDARIIFKGNDEHDYLYVSGNHGSKR